MFTVLVSVHALSCIGKLFDALCTNLKGLHLLNGGIVKHNSKHEKIKAEEKRDSNLSHTVPAIL